MAQQSPRIRHTVVFTLKHRQGSPEEKEFMDAAKKLSAIQGVENFECLRQISKKNNYDYGILMDFASQQLYEAYSNHPDHVAFIQAYWMKDVKDFLEIDYQLGE